MSLYQLLGKAAARLSRTKWGTKVPTPDGSRDTAVDPLAQEILAALSDKSPIEVTEPIRFIKKHRGPLFEVAYGLDDSESLAKFTRGGQEVSQVQPSAGGETSGATRVEQNISNAIGSLYRVVSISENGQVTLDEIGVDGQATGTQVQARSLT
jgi:hypothetical protein